MITKQEYTKEQLESMSIMVGYIKRDIVKVISAKNYFRPDTGNDWYIEFTDQYGRYTYWKQSLDGGQLVGCE